MVDGRQAQVATDRRRAIASGQSLPEDVHGAVVFADISGFTSLTETLARTLGARRGAEELSRLLDDVFGAVIDDVHRFSGEVISFAGDAITCFIDGDDGAAAAACGLAIQATMDRLGSGTTPTGEPYELKIKVVVGVGAARRFAVGDPRLLRIEALSGSLLDEVATAEKLAEPGEIVLAASAMDADLGEHTLEARGEAAVLVELVAPRPGLPASSPTPVIDDAHVEEWVHPGLSERLAESDARFNAELRPAHTFFIGIDGFDGDSPAAAAKLDRFIRRSQNVIDDHGGAMIQLTIGDKGAYAYAVFGAVTAHEDDAVRAVAAGLAVLAIEEESRLGSVRVGVAHGRLHIGAYGHPDRQTFGCLGDATNTAARLMMKAEPDTLCTTEAVRAQTAESFTWESIGSVALKGKAEPVALWRALSRVAAPKSLGRVVVDELSGRPRELDALVTAMAANGATVVRAEAGMGKSHLVEAALSRLPSSALVAHGETPTFGATAYAPWHSLGRGLLGIALSAEDRLVVAAIEERVAALGRGASRRLPLLGPVFGLEIPDNELTAGLDAKIRKVSAEGLFADLVAARPEMVPIVMVIDDVARLDELSEDLLAAVWRATPHLMLHVVGLTREAPESVAEVIRDRFVSEPIELGPLDADASETVVRSRLADLYGPDVEPSEAVIRFILGRGEGNPLYLAELVATLHRRGADVTGPAPARQDLPDGLTSLLLSQIDVLPEPSRRTIKIAGVVGRTFEESVVDDTDSRFGGQPGTRERLEEFRTARVAEMVPGTDEDWRFNNVLTQEVVYDSLPHSVRIQVHDAVGKILENRPESATIVERIAQHVWLSEDADRRRVWADRAGREAKERYANETAISWFERLSTIVEGQDRVIALRRLGEVHELVGAWEKASEAVSESLELARAIEDRVGEAWAEAALGEIERRRGRFDDAAARLERAEAIFSDVDDAEGRGRVFHLTGTLYAQQGEHDAAREAYEASLALRAESGDQAGRAAVLSNLGVIAEYEGDLAASERFHREALGIREGVGDAWAIAVSHTNLGMIALLDGRAADALASFEEAMGLFADVGDPWMIAIAHNNRGNALRDERRMTEAADDYLRAAATYADYGDRWAEAFLLEDVAILVAEAGHGDGAIALLGAADRARDDLGSPRPPGLETLLAQRLRNVFDEGVARAQGRDWSATDARRELAAWCRRLAGTDVAG